MSYLTAEASAQDSEPIELVEIVRSDGVVYYHTSASHDVSHDGKRWTAVPIDRSDTPVVSMNEESPELQIRLPANHPLAKRWTQRATPPKYVRVTVYRQNGGETRVLWHGDIEAMSIEGKADKVARFNIPARAGRWMLRAVPSLTVGRDCPYMLYDSGCKVSRDGSHAGLAHKVSTPAIAVIGRDVRVDLGSLSRNGQWSQYGTLKHVASGEEMTISWQEDASPGVSSVATVTMQAQIVGLKVGDTVEIVAGCDWTIATCHARFGNHRNFGGIPQLPTENPFVPGTSGVRKV